MHKLQGKPIRNAYISVPLRASQMVAGRTHSFVLSVLNLVLGIYLDFGYWILEFPPMGCSKFRLKVAGLEFVYWDLVLIWVLEFGIWIFRQWDVQNSD
ncbi:MAG: hypothetical protein LAO21_04230 [Acidobacteriia bacterium]|nr:hypothetical protein [Terriglobia bacterium]